MKTLHRELLTRRLGSDLVLGFRSAHVDIGCHISCVKLQKECEMVYFVIQLKVTLTFNRHQWLDSLEQFVAHWSYLGRVDMGCHTVTFKLSVPPLDKGADRLQTMLTAPLIGRPVEHDNQ